VYATKEACLWCKDARFSLFTLKIYVPFSCTEFSSSKPWEATSIASHVDGWGSSLPWRIKSYLAVTDAQLVPYHLTSMSQILFSRINVLDTVATFSIKLLPTKAEPNRIVHSRNYSIGSSILQLEKLESRGCISPGRTHFQETERRSSVDINQWCTINVQTLIFDRWIYYFASASFCRVITSEDPFHGSCVSNLHDLRALRGEFPTCNDLRWTLDCVG